MKNARVGLIVALSLMITAPAFAAPDQDQIEKGHKVYDKWCFPCHGTGLGKPGTDSLAARGQKPAVLEERVSLGHRATVHGAHIGAGSLIGMGAVVLGGATVGAGSLIAAGAVVLARAVVPAGVLFAGVPGRVVRTRVDTGDGDYLEHGTLPDPEGQLIDDLTKRIEQLEAQIKLLAEDRVAPRR